jgi:uncharacterized protein (UPF0333 family)
MDKKGQGALEYLLIIGGAVLVAAITIALISGTASGQKDPRAQAKCAILSSCLTCINSYVDNTNNSTVSGCIAVIKTGATAQRTAPNGTATAFATQCTMGSGESFKMCDTNKTV